MTGKIRHYYSGQITSVVNVDILRYDGRKWASRVTNSDLNFMIRNFRILHLAGVQLASYRGIYTPRYIHGHEHSSTHRDITRRSPIIEITLRWCTRIEPWKLNISVIASQVPMIVKPEIHCLLFFICCINIYHYTSQSEDHGTNRSAHHHSMRETTISVE